MAPGRRWYVGKSVISGERDVFASGVAPTEETHGHLYAYVIGPHRTRRGADLMAAQRGDNPHVRTASDADRIASFSCMNKVARRIRDDCREEDRRKSMRRSIGVGVFGWDSDDRRSDRYGGIHLGPKTFDGIGDEVSVDRGVIESLRGRRVRLVCSVKSSRRSGHLGDVFHGFFPKTPRVGEEVDLGVGVLDVGPSYDEYPYMLLRPGDGRTTWWMDPRKLYRLHDQTVELFAEETTDDFSRLPEGWIGDGGEPLACDNGDGTYQLKNVEAGDEVVIHPRVKSLGDGMFMFDRHPGRGEQLEVTKRRRSRRGGRTR